uniref:Interleukin-22 n=1 Tax=Oncorhynchus mykiss TaxID=8022 RepID=A0A8C7QMY5_ONCMY
MKFSTVQLVAAVVVVMSVCLLRESVAHSIHRPLSAPLHSADTDTMVQQVAQHAQSFDTDTDTKLMPDIDTKKNHRDICCLHANILDFYLSNILTTKEKQDKHHPKLPALKEDLARVSRDLKEHGCAIKHYNDHHHSIAFRKKLSEMEEGKGIKKAIGEIDILFTFLKDFCVHA